MASGGAEVVNEHIARRMAKHGYEVILLVAGVKGESTEEIVDGYRVIRVGDRWSVYWQAYQYCKKHLSDWPDLVIEEVNTIPFLTHFYIKNKPIVYVFYQLCREIWFYQMFFPLNWIGYWLEPLYLRLMAANKFTVLTESQSAKDDLSRFGFDPKLTHIFSVGLENDPVKSIDNIKKYDDPTMLSLGAIRDMKRPDQQIRAFELAKQKLPDLKLKIAGLGFGIYFQTIKKMIDESPYKNDIEYLGKVSHEKKIELMQRSHLITVTSVKEGWGLIVTEANSQGTPAVVYNVDGLRDSVKHGKTGLVTRHNTPQDLADNIVTLLTDKEKYLTLREEAWQWSKQITFERSYEEFMSHIKEKV